jgi:hypothetical protein
MKTITVQGWNNTDQEINKNDFVKQWWENSEIWNLTDYRDLDNTNKMRDEIREKIEALAELKFDLIWNDNNKQGAA